LGAPSADAPPRDGPRSPEPPQRPLGRLVALNTTLLTLGRLLTAAGGVVGIALATRYLPQGLFGQLLAALSFIGIFQVTTDLGLWTIASREIARRRDEERMILSAVFTLGMVLLVVTIILGLIGAFVLYSGASRASTREAIAILLIQFLLAGLAGSASAHLTAHQRAGAIALGAILSTALFVGFLAVVVSLRLGFAWVVVAYTLAAVSSPLLPIISMLRRVRLRLSWDSALLRYMLRTTLPQGLLLVLSVVYFRIDTVLLSLLSSSRQVALYGLAYRVVEFFAFLPVYFMGVLFPVLARTQPFSERLAELVGGATASMLVGGLATLALVVTFAPEVVRILSGAPSYAHAVDVLRLLSVSLLAIFITNAFFQTLIALNRQRNLIRIAAVVLVVNVAANCALIPFLGASGAAIALMISEVIGLALALIAYREIGPLPRIPRLWRILIATAGLGVSGWLVGSVLFGDTRHPVLGLVVGGAVALLVYGLLMRYLDALPPQLAATLADMRTRMVELMRIILRRPPRSATL
jgi:O-antigen/teichoic acid export membrane protein